MVSELAREDMEALISEGYTLLPSEVVRLNALGLAVERRPDFRLSTLPRVALCGGVLFREPTIAQDIFLDDLLQVFADDDGTRLALEAYVLAHPDKDWSKRPTFPRVFAVRCAWWIRKHLGKETASKVRHALDFCKFGVDPWTGEYPVYMADESFDKWFSATGEKSSAMRQYLTACTLGIAPDAALRATSPKLCAMIERAYLLHDRNITESEKEKTAQYFATLQRIKEAAIARRDAAKKMTETDGAQNG